MKIGRRVSALNRATNRLAVVGAGDIPMAVPVRRVTWEIFSSGRPEKKISRISFGVHRNDTKRKDVTFFATFNFLRFFVRTK